MSGERSSVGYAHSSHRPYTSSPYTLNEASSPSPSGLKSSGKLLSASAQPVCLPCSSYSQRKTCTLPSSPCRSDGSRSAGTYSTFTSRGCPAPTLNWNSAYGCPGTTTRTTPE